MFNCLTYCSIELGLSFLFPLSISKKKLKVGNYIQWPTANVSTDENMKIQTGSQEGGDGNFGQIQEPDPSAGVEENEENLIPTVAN